jgi:hypothetical protein
VVAVVVVAMVAVRTKQKWNQFRLKAAEYETAEREYNVVRLILKQARPEACSA